MSARHFKVLGAVGLVAVFATPFFVGNPFYTDIVITIFYYAALSLAWNLVGGYAGQFSLGHTAFFGVGAYTSTLLFLNLGLTPWIGMFVGGALAAVVALVVFTPCFRLKGFYFALASIALAEVLRILAVYWRGLTKGGVGLLVPVKPDWRFFLFESKEPYLVFAFALLVVMVGVTYWLGRSRLGHYLQAIREDESAAKAVGINVVWSKTVIMMVSAFFTAVGGSFYAQYMMFIDPEIVFSMHLSVQVALFAIIGGVATVAGPVLGAFLLVPLDAVMKGWLGTLYAGLGFVVYGVILIVVVMLMPNGIVKTAENLLRRRRSETAETMTAEVETELPPPAVEPPAGEILRVEGLCKSFGGLQAIVQMDLSVRRGEIVGVIGPNGAGKTTLFSLISAFLSPDRGSISFCGRDAVSVGAPHRMCALGLSRTFQVVRPFMHLSVLENVTTACLLRTHRVSEAEERALDVIRFVGLGHVADKPASGLTLANRKRVELARALATRPSLILLDEVMAGLNPSEINQIIELVRRISSTGVTLVVIEHVMKAVMALSDRIVVINFGQKIAEGTPSEIVANPLVIEAYLGKEAETMLEIRDLKVNYGDLTALSDLRLSVDAGSIAALVGSNGSGKTTLINTISGLLRPSTGSVLYEGTRLEREPPHRIVELGVVQVPEGRRLFPQMTVLENLLMGAYPHRARGHADETLEMVFDLLPRLKERTGQHAGTLSGGEQQMVALGRGLMARPQLLILDEPSLGLAPVVVRTIFETVKEVKKTGITVLLVEQNVRQVLLFCDRAFVLENTRISLEGNGSDLLENPHVREAYLGM